jgi:hypothetical protein
MALLIIYFPGYSGRENNSQSRQDLAMEQGVEGPDQNNPDGKTAAISELSWKPLIDPWMGQQKGNGQGGKEENGTVIGGETPDKNKK